MGKLLVNFIDRQGEPSSISVPMQDLTLANIAAQLALVTDLIDELDAIQASNGSNQDGSLLLGRLKSYSVVTEETPLSTTPPTSPFAQRETAWRVTYHGAITGAAKSTKKITLPCANLDLLTPQSEKLGSAVVARTNFITAFEALVRLKMDGGTYESVVVTDIEYVSRNE